jgi:hypothetical protein
MKNLIPLALSFTLTLPALAGDAAKPADAKGDKPAATDAAKPAEPAKDAPKADKVKVTDVGANGTVDCGKTPALKIAKGKLKITLTGACTSVSVAGGDNEIVADSVAALEVAGGKNKITVSKVDSIKLSGNKNEVTWVGTVDSTKTEPAVESAGKDNVVKKGDQAALDAAAKAALDTKAGKDAEKEAKKAEKEAKKGADDAAKKAGIKLP